MNKIARLIFLFIFSFSSVIYAQNSTDEEVNINNKPYYRHTVQKGETLYSLSKKYNVSIDDIKKATPGLGDIISVNQVVLIPIVKYSNTTTDTNLIEQNSSDEEVSINNKRYYRHTVQKGETLFSLSKKYNVTIDDIKKATPGLGDNLSVNQIVLIPIRRNATNTVSDTTLYVPKNKSDYLEITVQKGQTLYSISKSYNVSLNDILAINPTVQNGLKEGQIIYIPIKKLKETPSHNLNKTTNYITHKVSRKETLYSLSKQYNVSVDEIIEANNGLPDGLKNGEEIRIPVKQIQKFKQDVSINKNFIAINDSLKLKFDTVFKRNSIPDTLFNDSLLLKKEVYNIGVILPFFAKDNISLIEDKNPNQQLKLKDRSHIAYDMYNGIKLALDSMSKQGFKYKLYLFDTKGKDSVQIKSIVNNENFKKLDLIFGPLYSNNCQLVAQKANELNIPVICPVNQNNKVLLGNETLIKGVSSEVIRTKALAQKTMQDFSQHHKIVSYGTNEQENLLSDIFIRELSHIKDTIVDSTKLMLVSITKCDKGCITNILNNIKKDTVNIIYIPFKDDYKVTALLTALNNVLSVRNSKTKIILMGSEKILKYDNIDPELLAKVNFTYATSQSEDTLQLKNINCTFTKNKIKYSGTYAIDAFDFMYFFADRLYQFGENFLSVPLSNAATWKGCRNLILLQKTGIESGYENIGTAIHSVSY
jgi:LysM repeat protein